MPGQAALAAISLSMLAQRLPSTKYSSVETFPSFTSCVHSSSGILMPNALSMAKATSRKSRLSMPRSLMAWLVGVICSRGMSHVSAMIPATVSKVDDIDQPLQQRAGTNTAADASQVRAGAPVDLGQPCSHPMSGVPEPAGTRLLPPARHPGAAMAGGLDILTGSPDEGT